MFYLEALSTSAGKDLQAERFVELYDDYQSIRDELTSGRITRFVVTEIEISKQGKIKI